MSATTSGRRLANFSKNHWLVVALMALLAAPPMAALAHSLGDDEAWVTQLAHVFWQPWDLVGIRHKSGKS